MASPGIEAQLAEILARMAGVERQGEATAKDVREARDGVTRLTAVQEEQRVGERLEAMRRDLEREATERRSDLVNVAAQVGAKIQALDEKVDTTADVLDVKFSAMVDKLDGRVKAVEKVFTKGEGANALLQWVVKYGAWIVGGIGLLLGVKDNLGK